MNKIFTPDVEESYLRTLEKALEDKGNTQRSIDFAASFGKKNDEEVNLFKNNSDFSKKINNTNRNNSHNSNDENDNFSDEKNNNIHNRNIFNKDKNNSSYYNKNSIINNSSTNKFRKEDKNSDVSKSSSLHPFKDKKAIKELNKSVNNLLPGKNYARNILCKSLNKKLNTPTANSFEKTLRFFGSVDHNSSSNQNLSKSPGKKFFNNFSSNHTKSFDYHQKKNKILKNNKNTMKSPKQKYNNNTKTDYLFKDLNSHELSFSNKNNMDSNDKHDKENKFNKYRNDSNDFSNNKASNYSKKYDKSNIEEKDKNIIISDEYNYPYSSGNEDKEVHDEEDNLNQEIDDLLNENFNDEKKHNVFPREEQKFQYLGTQNSKKEIKNEEMKNYNFESDRVSHNKKDEIIKNNSDFDMEAI